MFGISYILIVYDLGNYLTHSVPTNYTKVSWTQYKVVA